MLSVVGELKNQTLVFLVDSGASNNFLGRADVEKLDLHVQQTTPSVVRLADGKKLTTKSFVEGLVSFGGIQAHLRFEVLECECLPILGFTFLSQVNPTIDWKSKQIWVQKGQRKITLQTYDSKQLTKRAFFALPQSLTRVEACGGVLHCALLLCLALTRGYDVVDLDCDRCGLPHVNELETCTPQRKHVCKGCKNVLQCDQRVVSNPLVSFVREHVGQVAGNQFADLDVFCVADVIECVNGLGFDLDGVTVSQFIAENTLKIDVCVPKTTKTLNNTKNTMQSFVSDSDDAGCFGNVVKGRDADCAVGPTPGACSHVGRQSATPRRVQSILSDSGVEMVSYRAFKRAAKTGQYQNMYLTFLQTPEESERFVGFTHRSSHGDLGHGDVTTLNTEAENMMTELKSSHSKVFSEPTYPVKRPRNFQHKIRLVDSTKPPPKRKLYPLDEQELTELKSQIQTFLDTNRIIPSSSPYGAPILFARKKDGRLRMCIDYRQLNENTVKDAYPLPRIDELMGRLNGARYFSKLDLRDGYHQIEMDTQDTYKTAFTTRYGTFEWRVMPFGLCNAPSTFQRVMNDVFFDLLDQGVLVYLDDVLIYSKSLTEHKALLRKVFDLLQKHNLYVKESKCSLFLQSVEFLGVQIDSRGMAMERGKIQAVVDWPQPKNVNEVQQFLGLCNYYRKFIFRYSQIANPLILLTRKDITYTWGQAEENAFQTLKKLMTDAPVLKLFDQALDTRLICDASDFCVGAVLEQKHSTGWHPVEFLSKKLNQAQQNYSATDREFLAIIFSLEKFRHYLIGRKFQILTDHAALTHLKTKATLSKRQARWLDFLSDFDFEINHVAGKSNVADYLSRLPQTLIPAHQPTPTTPTNETSKHTYAASRLDRGLNRRTIKITRFADTAGKPLDTCRRYCSGRVTLGDCVCGLCDADVSLCDLGPQQTLTSVISLSDHEQLWHHLSQSQQECREPWFVRLQQRLSDQSSGVHLRYGVLCKQVDGVSIPVVPRDDVVLINTILRELHCSVLGGHVGPKKLLGLVKQRFYWQNMHVDVERFCRECPTCQEQKSSSQAPAGLLQPLDPPSAPFSDVTMDFITQLPLSVRGFDGIFTVVDRFSKFTVLIPFVCTMSAEDIAQLFFERVICVFGMPQRIVSDRDPKFMSSFWRGLMSLLDCKLSPSTSYHPQTDGLSERYNRSLEQVLRCYCSGEPSRWCLFLSAAMFALNSTMQSSLGVSPCSVMFGREVSLPLDHAFGQLHDCRVESVAEFVSRRRDCVEFVREQLRKSAVAMKRYADRRRRDVEFAVGDYVMLSTQNLRTPEHTSRKLTPRWIGPFQVAHRVGPVAYRLDLPQRFSAIHPVFHVSLLKPHFGPVRPGPEPVFQDEAGEHFEVEAIVRHRGAGRRREYLVRWLGYPDHENRWLTAEELAGAPEILRDYCQAHGLRV